MLSFKHLRICSGLAQVLSGIDPHAATGGGGGGGAGAATGGAAAIGTSSDQAPYHQHQKPHRVRTGRKAPGDKVLTAVRTKLRCHVGMI